jgi:vacuolar-type H+-ATPase catalytic subunit A/Vma1
MHGVLANIFVRHYLYQNIFDSVSRRVTPHFNGTILTYFLKFERNFSNKILRKS